MKAYETEGRDDSLGGKARRFGHWLSKRPLESWGFFIAGILIARILF